MKAERQSRLEMMLDREARLKSHLFQKINEDREREARIAECIGRIYFLKKKLDVKAQSTDA